MQRLVLAAIVIGGAATPALAERPEDRVWLQGGVFYANADTFARVDNPTLGIPGTPIDFEGDLGLREKEWLPKIAGGVRLGKAFRIEADYFSLDRNGTKTLDDLLGVDDTVFPAGSAVYTTFRTNIWRIAAGWSPWLTENGEFGLALGVHLTDVKFQLEADADVEGEPITLFEERSAVIPLPNASVFGNYSFDKTWAIHGKVDLLALKVGDYTGKLVDVQFGVSAQVQKHIGLGVAYRYVNYDLKTRSDDWGGELRYRYHGPLAYVEIGF